jgi:hypothetical protein
MSGQAPLDRAIDDLIASGVLPTLLAQETVAVAAQIVDLGFHPRQQLVR